MVSLYLQVTLCYQLNDLLLWHSELIKSLLQRELIHQTSSTTRVTLAWRMVDTKLSHGKFNRAA